MRTQQGDKGYFEVLLLSKHEINWEANQKKSPLWSEIETTVINYCQCIECWIDSRRSLERLTDALVTDLFFRIHLI